jgi:hypothetical protein
LRCAATAQRALRCGGKFHSVVSNEQPTAVLPDLMAQEERLLVVRC